jgi:hypothetical protein
LEPLQSAETRRFKRRDAVAADLPVLRHCALRLAGEDVQERVDVIIDDLLDLLKIITDICHRDFIPTNDIGKAALAGVRTGPIGCFVICRIYHFNDGANPAQPEGDVEGLKQRDLFFGQGVRRPAPLGRGGSSTFSGR